MEKKMKKKYVVYTLLSYTDDYGFLQYNKHKVGEYDEEEDAIIRAYVIRNMGYNVKIEEEWEVNKMAGKIMCLRAKNDEDRINARVWAEKFIEYLQEVKYKYPRLHINEAHSFKVYCMYSNKGNLKGFVLYKTGSSAILGSLDVFGVTHLFYLRKELESVCLRWKT